jgi:shikimate dehydrogenase
MDRYAVVGNPIGHSKSPQIHAAFARQTGQSISYEALLAPVEGFADFARNFFNNGGKGLNVTVPFKLDAFQFADRYSARARNAGAVNTLSIDQDNKILGDNTDGVGLVRDILSNHQGVIRNRRVLVLGAGGAVRGVLEMIMKEQPAHVTIANRTVARAEQLAASFADCGPASATSFAGLASERYDLVINGTSASLQGDLPPLPSSVLAPGAWSYDLMYTKGDTTFTSWAKAHGASKTLDGLGMLVEQAAESFFIWRQIRPETQPVIQMIREQLQ